MKNYKNYIYKILLFTKKLIKQLYKKINILKKLFFY